MKPLALQPKFVRQAEEKAKKKAFKNLHRRNGGAPSGRSQNGSGGVFLELYQREDEPGCHAVRNRLSQLGLDFICHSVPVGNALKHEQLKQIGGKDQIPFLFDPKTGLKLYEAEKIISYLEKEYGKPQANPINRFAMELDARVRSRADQLAWAIRSPFDRARDLVDDFGEGVSTLKKSYEVVRNVVRAPLKDREKKKAA